MFNGIIEEIGKVISTTSGKLTVAAKKVLGGTELGASMAVNGVCLTVTSLTSSSFTADVMAETLRRTNLGRLAAGSKVNLERPLRFGGAVGGHLVEGHVDGTGRVTVLAVEDGSALIRIEATPGVLHYVVEKGFIAVDGISLTVTEVTETEFGVSIVDFTSRNTILSEARVGAIVNLEADIIAKYVEKLTRPATRGLTVDFLREHGFTA